MLMIWEKDENLGVDMMKMVDFSSQEPCFSGSLAKLIECDSLVQGHDLVSIYQL